MNTSPDTTCGRVLLFTGGDPIAAIVKWQSRSHYSHAARAAHRTGGVSAR